ncbi:MAG: hypothetical protein NUV98_03370 [Candidatus Roizmanbacteria bacterium]|nr:hypothetical protein [Candidatus Roizmanbacteria bacterium]
MEEKILKDQLSFQPQLENKLPETIAYDNVIVGGMGGSALPAKLLFFLDPVFPLWLHDDYGLPEKNNGKTLFVAISYSGNTREALSFAKEALEKNYPLAIISSGGALLEMAKKNNITYITVPSGVEPREGVIYMLRALLFLTGQIDLLTALENAVFDYESFKLEGEKIGESFEKEIPLIYASRRNSTLALIWKIMLNESGKLPAFSNIFPELTHNEMQSIASENGEGNFKVLLLQDSEDEERVKHSMEVFTSLAPANKIKLEVLPLPVGNVSKLLHTLVAAYYAGQIVAQKKGIDPVKVPFIELFKKSL